MREVARPGADHEALVRAVFAARPGSSDGLASRLVLADWLDDHGEADRAELIRVQTRLGPRTRRRGPKGADDVGRQSLVAQEALLEKRLLPSLGKVPRPVKAAFQHGFLHLTLPADRLDGRRCPTRLVELAAGGWVEVVRLTGPVSRLDPAHPLLAAAGNLDLRGVTLDDRLRLDLARWPLPPPGGRLTRFLLDPEDEQMVATLRGDPAGAGGADPVNLELIYREDLTPDDLRSLTSTPGFARVRELRLTNSRIGCEGVAALLESPYLTGLVHLDLDRAGVGDAGAVALARCRTLPALERLELWGNRIGPAGLEPLLAWAHARRLPRLNIGCNPLGDGGAAVLARSDWLAWQARPEIGQSQIGDPGVAALAASPAVAGVRELSFLGGPVTDAGANALAESPNLGEVRTVCLMETQVTPAGVLTVLLSERLPALELVTGPLISGRREPGDGPGPGRLQVKRGVFGTEEPTALDAECWRLLVDAPLTRRAGVLRLQQIRIDAVALEALTGPTADGLRALELSRCALAPPARERLLARFGAALTVVR